MPRQRRLKATAEAQEPQADPPAPEPAAQGLRGARHERLVAYATALGVLLGLFISGYTAYTGFQAQRQQADAQLAADFTAAITQIGASDTEGSTEVRLGGVYTLGRVIHADPARFQQDGCDVLVALVDHRLPTTESKKAVSNDVKGAFTALAANCDSRERLLWAGVSLEGRSFGGLRAEGLNLIRADLLHAELRDAYLVEADLRGSELNEADLSGANLSRADLFGASLRGVRMRGSELVETSLVGANLANADLVDAGLGGADLTFCNLTGANLTGAHLDGAHLKNMIYDESTVWPEGFTPPPPRKP